MELADLPCRDCSEDTKAHGLAHLLNMDAKASWQIEHETIDEEHLVLFTTTTAAMRSESLNKKSIVNVQNSVKRIDPEAHGEMIKTSLELILAKLSMFLQNPRIWKI